MRWIRFNCILMASLSILSATEAETSRNRRDLSYVKNFIKTAIFGRENKPKPELVLVKSGENYKIFRIPGFKNVLVKAVPKVTGADAVPDKVDLVSPENSKAGIVASYLGTKTQSETLDALQGVKMLLGSGILTATKDQAVPIGALPPHLQLIGVGDGTFEKPHILLDTSTVCDEVQADENPVVVQQPTIWQGPPFLSILKRPILFPKIVKPVSPVKVPVPASPTEFSYKQFHGDGKVTTYTANEDQNVIVTQSDQPEPLPPIVTYRIQEVMKLGAYGMQGLATIPVFVQNIQRPSIQYFTSPKVIPYRPLLSPVENNFSYKQIHNDGTVTSYSSGQKNSEVVVTEGGKVSTIPTFITNRIENVASTAGAGKQPNPVFLFGLNTTQAQWYNPLLYEHHMGDTKGVRVNVDTMGQQKTLQNQHSDIGSQGTYSYHMIHKDGSVTKHGGSSVFTKPATPEIKPISPLLIEDKLKTIAKTSSGSFSYKILHNDGSVTNYGVFGVHEGNNGETKIEPIYKTTPANNKPDNFISGNRGLVSQPQVKDKSSTGYSYKRIHKDGSVTSYASNDVVEDLQVTNNGNLHVNVNKEPKAGMFPHDAGVQLSSEVNNVKIPNNTSDSKSNEFTFHQYSLHTPLIGNPSPASFIYKTIHSDGSETIYSPNDVKEINKQQKFIDQNSMQHSVNAVGTSKQEKVQKNIRNNAGVIFNTQDSKQNEQVSTQNNADSGTFSYTVIRNDGSATIFSENGVKEETAPFKNKNQIPSSAASTSQLANNKHVEGSAQKSVLNQAEKQSIHVSSQSYVGPGFGSFSNKPIHNDGSMTIYSQNGMIEENLPFQNKQSTSATAADVNEKGNNQNVHVSGRNIVIPVSGSFSYKTVHNDGSTTTYSQSGVKEENFSFNNILSTSAADVNQPRNNHVSGQSIVVPVSGSFSYKAVHNDGSTTNYSQNGVNEENLPLKNILPTSAADVNQPRNNHVNGQNLVIPVSGSFSYKTVHNDGSTTTYSQNDVKKENEVIKNTLSMSVADVNQQRNNQNDHVSGQNIVVPDSVLSSYKAGRNDGSIYTQSGTKEENYAKESHMTENDNNQNQQSVNDMKVNMNEQHLHTYQRSEGTSFPSSYLYKTVHNDGSETNYSGQGVEEIKATSHNYPINTPNEQYSINKNDGVTTEKNINTNLQHSSNLSGLFSYRTNHSDGFISNMQSDPLQKNVENRDQSFSQLEEGQFTNKVIPPPPKLPELNGNDFSVTPVGVLVADSNKVLFTKPVVSSYSYKQINHNSPDQFEVAVNVGEAVSTDYKQINHNSPDQFKVALNVGETVSTNSQLKVSGQIAEGANNTAVTVDTIPMDYVYIPPENVNEPLPIKSPVPNVRRDETNSEKLNPPSVVVLASQEVVPCVEKSLSEHPIVVLDEPMMYSYQQRKYDGTAVHIESNQSVVSVNVLPKEQVKNRGDIPESP